MGTWAFTMTEPEEFSGSRQTVTIWDEKGVVVASFQIEEFPSRSVTGIFKDGEMLVLTISHDATPPLLENGAPIWAIIALSWRATRSERPRCWNAAQPSSGGSARS
jgi:hypothetical protein